MYNTLKKEYYWPGLHVSCYNNVRSCVACAHRAKMKLFPATLPFEEVAMDILGEFLTASRGNKYLLVIVERFTKLVRTIPLKNHNSEVVAREETRGLLGTSCEVVQLLGENLGAAQQPQTQPGGLN